MRAPALLTIGAALIWADVGHAGDCAEPYTTDLLLGDLIAVEDLLRSGDDEAAGAASKKLESGLGCMNEVLPPMIAGRAYRAVAAGLVASGDVERGSAWFRTASEIEQAFEYGLEDLPEDHPVRDVYATARREASGDQVPVDGKELVPVGTHYLDGRTLDEPRARLDRPHIYQHETGEVKTWLVEGNAFPAEVLAVPAPVAAVDPEPEEKPAKAKKVRKKKKKPKPKKEKVAKAKKPKPEKVKTEKVAKNKKSKKKDKAAKAPTTSGGTMVLERQRPWEKTPLMIGGGAIVAAGGGLYALALQRRGDFESASTEDDVLTFAKQANQMVIASAAVLAVGTGTLTWGIILDGGSPVPTFHVRF